MDESQSVTSAARVLVTGFEPFSGARQNSSMEVVEWLQASAITGVSLEVLPVEFDRSVDLMVSRLKELDPEIVIALGQAEGRSKVSFERIAVNLNDARIADNSGEIRRDSPITPEGEAAYMALFPVRKVVGALTERGFHVEESLSAGAFVCNHLFYETTRYLREMKSHSWMDFVHLPLVDSQADEFLGKPTLATEVQGSIILSAIEEARRLWNP